MRRSEREITDRAAIDAILARAQVLTLAMVDDDRPYVVPLHFGYDGTALYLHAALEGRKMAVLRRHPRVSFAVYVDDEVIPGEVGCAWSARYRSVLGDGTVCWLTTHDARMHALDTLLGKYAAGPFSYREDVLARTAVLRVDIDRISGKQAGW